MLRVVGRDSIVLRYEFRDIKQANHMELYIFENRFGPVFEHLL